MIAEINLLPKKETRQPIRLILLLGAALLLLVAFGLYWMIERADHRQAVLEAELKKVRAEQSMLAAKAKQADEGKEWEELAKAVEWAQRYPLKSVPLLRALTKQLPERGFVMNVEYSSQTKMTLMVQFDAPEEAAYYLDRLGRVKAVKSAKLVNVTANVKAEDGQTGDQVVPRYIAQYELEMRQTGGEEKPS
ncbi:MULTISPECIES: hypothetical protein [Geobacillus]|uniref:Fimbrial protein n=1 Tax=Geobacillus thermocatenulatus TaxID=33938 RepID=A0A226QAP8_9BACL|nr:MULTISPECIES: hypothetical protein [Geobacillus]KPD01592.1 hypothetical protein LR69_00207 [Geobacillus sp. BCO2]RAN22562.1 fimbrial protein [Geobacillus sp. A8]ASS98692.1 fimbrial protein [Geobacillus thermocatenulatus]KLR73949.1 fimbrial protein [Geobacillus sp. T6]OXB89445.1 fimbrial protein [Geobacillus thermocatenulatus]